MSQKRLSLDSHLISFQFDRENTEVPTPHLKRTTYIYENYLRKFGELFQNLRIPKREIVTIPSTFLFFKKKTKIKKPTKSPRGVGFLFKLASQEKSE